MRLPVVPSRGLLLLAVYHSAEDDAQRASIAQLTRRLVQPKSTGRVVILANTELEVEMLSSLGVETVMVNHNAFVDERLFQISPAVLPRFNAICDAQLGPYKRHYLAAKIPNLALISYLHRPSPDMAYARHMRRDLAHASWLNDPLAHGYKRLAPAAVAESLNSSQVGLCLSETEGAMYASTQYLLCGLPVVSTKNRGGRDYFFEPTFARTVPPIPEAVAAAVADFVRNPPDKEHIRRRTLARIAQLRNRFCQLVEDHLRNHGVSPCFEEHFRKIFFHTQLLTQPVPRFWNPEERLAR